MAPRKLIKMSSDLDEQGTDRTVSMYLPWELVSEILLRSPVRSLRRFKSVCKRWKSHISSPEFVQKHLENQLSLQANPNTARPFILRCYSRRLNKDVYFVHRGDQPGINGEKFTQLDHRVIEREEYSLRNVGSHNGIVCFLGANCSACTMTLWNPSSQESIDIKLWFGSSGSSSYRIHRGSVFDYDSSHRQHLGFGFGYDSWDEDYKAVHLLCDERLSSCSLNLYSLKRNQWKTIDVDPTLVPYKITKIDWLSQTILEGRPRVHWLVDCVDVDRERFRTILSFDVRDEVLGQIPLPPDDRDCAHDHDHKRVVELASFVDDRDRKGLLTLFEYNNEREEDCNNGSRFRCYVWVMKEYGSVDSWTKSELNISLSKPFSVVGFLSESMLLIRVTDGSMILYDTKTQRKECLRIDAHTKILSYVGTYMESFFRLKNN